MIPRQRAAEAMAILTSEPLVRQLQHIVVVTEIGVVAADLLPLSPCNYYLNAKALSLPSVSSPTEQDLVSQGCAFLRFVFRQSRTHEITNTLSLLEQQLLHLGVRPSLSGLFMFTPTQLSQMYQPSNGK